MWQSEALALVKPAMAGGMQILVSLHDRTTRLIRKMQLSTQQWRFVWGLDQREQQGPERYVQSGQLKVIMCTPTKSDVPYSGF